MMKRALVGAKKQAGSSFGLGKRKAEISPKKNDIKKRSALGDLTNASKKNIGGAGKAKDKEQKPVKEEKELRITRARSKSSGLAKVDKPELLPKSQSQGDPPQPKLSEDKDSTVAVKIVESKLQKPQFPLKVSKEEIKGLRSKKPARISATSKNIASTTTRSKSSLSRGNAKTSEPSKKKETTDDTSDDDDDNDLYQTALGSPDKSSAHLKDETLPVQTTEKTVALPPGVTDFDKETKNDIFQVSEYVQDIFAYYRRREIRFVINKYMDTKHKVNQSMRAILIDWMVEVQESFEMNHETLYLAVKIVDMYLDKERELPKEMLQLVATTALYLAAKYDERCPPLIDDFCYICEDAYEASEVIKMEAKILKALNFDLGIPLSYRFLRRFARCAKLEMDTLTLARFILELSLMEYDFIDVRDSMMAAAALLLALKMKKRNWNATLEYYSEYSVSDLFDLTHRLHNMMQNARPNLKTIRSKYSHTVFFEVAKTPLPEVLDL